MRRWRRWVVAALVTTVLVVLLIPETWLFVSERAQLLVDALVGEVSRPIPAPVVIGVGMILLLIMSFATIFSIVRVFTSYGAKSGQRIATYYEQITPNSPQTKGLVFMVAFVVVFIVGVGVVTPWFASSLTEDSGIGDVVDDIQEGRYAGNLERLFTDDAVEPRTAVVSMRGVNDTDGDGLRDSWEEAGRIPNGTALPGADPDSLDLYVQINYGANVSSLSDSELESLEQTWAEMPVENPDGTQGIDLHVIDQRGSAGQVGNEVAITGPSSVGEFYTRERLESRYCVYRQVVLGQVQAEDSIGYSEAPGYVAVVDGSRYSAYTGDVPFRVAMLTHTMLHTVIGTVDGSAHTETGWLAHPDSETERLSRATARTLRGGFQTTEAYQQRCAPALNGST